MPKILVIVAFQALVFLPASEATSNKSRSPTPSEDSLQHSALVEFTCSRQTLYLEDQRVELGSSEDCSQDLNYLVQQGHRELFMFSLSHSKYNRDPKVSETFGLSEQSVKAVVRGRILPWLKGTVLHYEDSALDDDDPYKLQAGYIQIDGQSGLPLDLTLGLERDNTSSLKIAQGSRTFGSSQDNINATTHFGAMTYDQEFRDGSQRKDERVFGAVQVNANQIDQSMILGIGKEINGPESFLIGLHGKLGKKSNEWMTICRVRKTRNSKNEVRTTEFCLVSISIDNKNLDHGRYVNLLGTFVPGMVRPTRIVNGSTLNENPTTSNTQSPLDRPKWEFVASVTDVQITDTEDLRIQSYGITRSFDGQFYNFRQPHVGVSYDSNNFLYFDEQEFVLRGDDDREILNLNIGFGLGGKSIKDAWAIGISIGRDLNNDENALELHLAKPLYW